ncbi:uncharacterized protein LOC120260550 [Dioscorea cayenensis subsp. rotundata]|uniref:Uncharacterized protein LOC120260550 n=1 Tax=Dioscorea cayennensis subsp. rotundata TaxID=55577 RepID=A0AB40B9K3_DIOCR|nr:uncharacterized protein LOC120260550 [Dioscorea cayenensis subsp. rotundata]
MSRFAMHPNSERPIFCPKPRRLSQLSIPAATDLDGCRLRPTPFDTIAGAELLDIFLSKGGEQNNATPSSPPFFTGSPPSRSANPLIHDARFREPKLGPIQTNPAGSPMSPTRKGCAPTKYGFKPAPVRIEGFDCLERRDRPSRSITAVA